MIGHELAVEQSEIAGLQSRNQPSQRNFRGVRRVAEHAFAEKGSPKLYSIKSAGELVADPHFERMGMAGRIESEHCPFDVGVDPGFLAIGAGGDYCCKLAVEGDREHARANGTPQRTRQMEAVERQDRPVAWLDPEQLGCITAVRHRENAGGVTLQ